MVIYSFYMNLDFEIFRAVDLLFLSIHSRTFSYSIVCEPLFYLFIHTGTRYMIHSKTHYPTSTKHTPKTIVINITAYVYNSPHPNDLIANLR